MAPKGARWLVQTGLSMVSGHVACGPPHTHGAPRALQSSGNLRSRTALSHPGTLWLGGFTSLKALQSKGQLVEATKPSKSRLGLFTFSCSCISLLLNSRGIERLKPGLRLLKAQQAAGTCCSKGGGSWTLEKWHSWGLVKHRNKGSTEILHPWRN